MRNKMAVFMLASSLMVPSAFLWAAAGDASQPGASGTAARAPSAKTNKKHHGHHHKKSAASAAGASSTSGGSSTPGMK